MQSLASGERRVLIPGGSDGRYVGTGHLLYMQSGTLMAVPFDVRSQQLSGAPVAMIEGVMHGVTAPNSGDETGAGQFAMSANGSLLYVIGGIGRRVESSWAWVDRTGAAQRLEAVPPGAYVFPRRVTSINVVLNWAEELKRRVSSQ